MAKKVFNMQGGRHSAAALSSFINAMYGSSVANGLDVRVTGSAGLNVLVKIGNGIINTGTGFGRLIQIDADETVALTAASASNPRNDIIVAYIDNSVTPTTAVTDNTNNILKFAAVAGTPAGSPTDPSGSAIQAAVGAGNPYMILGRVRVNTSATSLTAPNITDLRKVVRPFTTTDLIQTADIADSAVTTAKIADTNVTTAKVADKAITEAKMDLGSISKIKTRLSGTMSVTPSSIKVPFNTTEFVMGSKLTRSGSDVVIGTGVSYVRVSLTLMLENGSGASYIYGRIQRNTTLMAQVINPFAGGFAAMSETTIIPVSAGDTISAILDCGTGSAQMPVSRLPELLVEVVG